MKAAVNESVSAHDSFAAEVSLLSESLATGHRRSHLSVPGIRCGGCVAKIEKTLNDLDGIDSARANLTLKRVSVDWNSAASVELALQALKQLGFDATLISNATPVIDALGKRYLRATAVAGFAAGNIMMLSVAVWAGAENNVQLLFHTLSAFLALAAVLYSGTIFFESAWSALKRGRTNMDVPISIGVALSMALGLYDTFHGGSEVYFEAATMLIFFLLIGRTLDHSMRQRAESSLSALSRIAPRSALLLKPGAPATIETNTTQVDVEDITIGNCLLIPTNHRVPVDARLTSGESEFDTSIVDGEPLPKQLVPGDALDSGVKNLGPPVVVTASRDLQHSFLSRTQRLVETVSFQNGRYQTLSERVARWYAPVVHCAALAAGLLWYANGADLHRAVTIAIAVLIITCPCALGLAVPMVQVLAGGKLFKNGVVMKNGSALERLSDVDTVVFDKTGTLTERAATLRSALPINQTHSDVLYSLAQRSNHPFAQAIVQSVNSRERRQGLAVSTSTDLLLSDVREYPGEGIEGFHEGIRYQLGSVGWIHRKSPLAGSKRTHSLSSFSADGIELARFEFEETLRADAQCSVNALASDGCKTHIASGDMKETVLPIAKTLGIQQVVSDAAPAQKAELIQRLKAEGDCVLMVGDGINDTVALAAADVSFAMGDAGDVGANSADFVLMHNKLAAIDAARQLALSARKLAQQNITIAVVYNLIAVPIAFAGWVSPLVAAIAMSTSSLLVVGNSLRLNYLGTSTELPGRQSVSADHPYSGSAQLGEA